MAKPLKKSQYDRDWKSYQPESDTVTDVTNPITMVKNLFFRLFGPRKHNRKDMNFSHPVKLRVTLGTKIVEPIVEDLGKGGMGFRCTTSAFPLFKENQTLDFEIALDGVNYETVRAEVRYLLELGFGGFVGVKFVEISSDLLKKIQKESRQNGL